ncbi:hypothetical protein R5H32_17660 [Defluviimonas sp. D31]|nr:hypothetical protein [Defluviimonas sp. D31]MDW4551193.1 hypothetical protein [Defluviimonas sp. D31]
MAVRQVVPVTSPGPSEGSAGPEVALPVVRDEALGEARVSPDDDCPTNR